MSFNDFSVQHLNLSQWRRSNIKDDLNHECYRRGRESELGKCLGSIHTTRKNSTLRFEQRMDAAAISHCRPKICFYKGSTFNQIRSIRSQILPNIKSALWDGLPIKPRLTAWAGGGGNQGKLGAKVAALLLTISTHRGRKSKRLTNFSISVTNLKLTRFT